MNAAPPLETRRIRLRGRVQGVGMRPTVWRLARRLGLQGTVRNDGQGVEITARATPALLDAFLAELRRHCPPLARIEALTWETLPGAPAGEGFRITESRPGPAHTAVAPDTAPCPACLEELFDPGNRRHRYPFLNCTHCGPRLSVVRALPYDRARTTLAGFPLCARCRAEYRDPADRRFHAQPTACPDCGPRAWLADAAGREIPAEDPLAAAAARLRAGEILAVRGVGGFHLACDAQDAAAVARLRARRRRPHKPLALLFRDLRQLRAWVRLDEAAAAALGGPAAPIVLLPARDPARLPGIAPGLAEWGVLLPPSPLHHLLMADLDGPLVFTSGNRSGEPPCLDNEEALDRLADIADAFLLHDRPIARRVDDSVLRPLDGHGVPLRVGRGLAPLSLPLPAGLADAPPLLALGGEQKTTLCLVQDGRAVLTPHVGDLTEARTLADYRAAWEHFTRLYDLAPTALAVDRHPGYHSSREGRARAAGEGLTLIAVQHHHAHLAACLGEHGVPLAAPPALGVVLDGLGLGDDGGLWGGEILLGDYRRCRRLAHLRPVPLPGGDAAQREPWRVAWAHLHTALGAVPALPGFADKPLATLARMLERGLNSPPASSAGRLFDAVAWVLGLAPDRLSHEAQAAQALEAAVDPAALDEPYPFALERRADGPWRLDPAPLWRALLADRAAGAPVGMMAARFHAGLAAALAAAVMRLAAIHGVHRVALSGGVFANRVLLSALAGRLRGAGLEVLSHRQVPPNDGGLALGQALVAAARLLGSDD